MSDSKTQEPSMEEILASIRRIISEDSEETKAEEPAAEAEAAEPELETEAEAEPEPEPEPELEPEPEPEPELEPEPEEEEILDLTEAVEEEDGLPAYREEEPQPLFEEQRARAQRSERPPQPPLPPQPPPVANLEGLVSRPAADEAVSAFANLKTKLEEGYEELPIGNGRITLEQLTRELMRPMLKEWLDQHLPIMVERLVREEIERLVMQSQRRDFW